MLSSTDLLLDLARLHREDLIREAEREALAAIAKQ